MNHRFPCPLALVLVCMLALAGCQQGSDSHSAPAPKATPAVEAMPRVQAPGSVLASTNSPSAAGAQAATKPAALKTPPSAKPVAARTPTSAKPSMPTAQLRMASIGYVDAHKPQWRQYLTKPMTVTDKQAYYEVRFGQPLQKALLLNLDKRTMKVLRCVLK